MASKKKASQQNENSVTEQNSSLSVSEDGDLQGRDSQRNDHFQEVSSPSDEPTYEVIAVRAYELWIENGCQTGFHEADWSRAEQELRAKGEKPMAKSASVSS